MEAATSRTIRIGSASIGLIGLDRALNEAATQDLPEEEAVDSLFNAIALHNYIPSGLEKQYREALLAEYRRHRQGTAAPREIPVIRVFGSGCVSCRRLQELVIDVLAGMHLAADIEQIHDPDEIGRHGILRTPALLINDSVKCEGIMPSRAYIEQWIREAGQ